MSNDSRQILELAMRKIESLEADNKQLQRDIARLSEVEARYIDLLGNYERLKLARAFGQSEDDKKRAYRRLTNMITEIDKCLEMLND